MTARERILTILIGSFLGLFVLGMGVYFLVYVPISDRSRAAENLENEISEKDTKLRAITKDLPRMTSTLQRSLPADLDVARTEYDAAINRLLREAKVPVTAYSVKPKASDGKPVPELAPKKPAYTRIALEITMKPVDQATLIDVLRRYYRMGLLQQIVKLTVKKIEGTTSSASVAARRSGSGTYGTADRADLDVTIVTEAIILDGAESRRSLLPISTGFGAAGGGAGYQALLNSPEPARGLTPMALAQVLAVTNRDYAQSLVKDIFHGPPPPPPPPPAPRTEPVEPPPPPKEDTSAFIRLTGIGRNPDGTGSALIEDAASKQEYAIEVVRQSGKLVANVVKFYFTAKGQKKQYAPEPELDISEASSGTARKFLVIGLDGDTLVLTETGGKEAPAAAPAPPAFGNPAPPAFGGGGSPRRPKVSPGFAVVGGMFTPPPEVKVFAWRHGEPLSKIVELKGAEATKALSEATNSSSSKVSVPPAALSNSPAEIDPGR